MTTDSPPPTEIRAALRRALDAFADALRFFTRLPAPAWLGSADGGYDGVAGASPLAGAAVGAGAALALAAALVLGLPALPAAVISAAAAVALSGALHLDGLADVADGFGGGATRERKLEIMRDSRLGVFGGAALALALMLRVGLVAALVERLGPAGAALGLIAAAALSRPLAFLPAVLFEPVRLDGLGHGARPGVGAVAAGLALGALAAMLLGGLGAGLLAFALGAIAAAAVSAVAQRQIGGYTGDVCGAAAELGELAALAALVAAAGAG